MNENFEWTFFPIYFGMLNMVIISSSDAPFCFFLSVRPRWLCSFQRNVHVEQCYRIIFISSQPKPLSWKWVFAIRKWLIYMKLLLVVKSWLLSSWKNHFLWKSYWNASVDKTPINSSGLTTIFDSDVRWLQLRYKYSRTTDTKTIIKIPSWNIARSLDGTS